MIINILLHGSLSPKKIFPNIITAFNLFIFLFCIDLPGSRAQRTHRLFWDDKNPVFNYGNNRMFVEEGDEVTIICPYNSPEYNVIYWGKNKDTYDLCDHSFDKSIIKLFTCEPFSSREFSFLVSRFSWVSLNPTFLPGKHVYLLSQENICREYNMKIVIILRTNEKKNETVIKKVASPERVFQAKTSHIIYISWRTMAVGIFLAITTIETLG